MASPVVVLDNGAATIKVGIVDPLNPQGSSQGPRIIPNAVVRSKGDKLTYFGHEFARCRDYSSLHYRLPFEKVRRVTCYMQNTYSMTGIPCGLGCTESRMGRHFFHGGSWGKSGAWQTPCFDNLHFYSR
jgi:hypothetical protein